MKKDLSSFHFPINGQVNLINSVKEELSKVFKGQKILITDCFDIYKKNSEYDIHFHYAHRKDQYNAYADVNLSNGHYGDNYFFFPPLVRRVNISAGEKIIIPDYKKAKKYCDELIKSNPETSFKIIYNRDLEKRNNVERVFEHEDIGDLCSHAKAIFCVSQVRGESYGLLPIELSSSGVPVFVSSSYKIPILNKINFVEKSSIEEILSSEHNGIEQFNQYENYHYQILNNLKRFIKFEP